MNDKTCKRQTTELGGGGGGREGGNIFQSLTSFFSLWLLTFMMCPIANNYNHTEVFRNTTLYLKADTRGKHL